MDTLTLRPGASSGGDEAATASGSARWPARSAYLCIDLGEGMTETKPQSRRQRRRDSRFERPPLSIQLEKRAVAWALLRGLVTAAALVVLYAALPLDGTLNARGGLLLVVGLVVFGVTAAWQIHAILVAQYPVLQAVEALAIVIPLFLLTFSAVYYGLAHSTGHAFTQSLNKVDAVYFTVTVFATVGFGDIAPVTQTARILTTVQMLADLVVLGVLLRVILGAVRLTRQHRSQPPAESAPESAPSGGDQT